MQTEEIERALLKLVVGQGAWVAKKAVFSTEPHLEIRLGKTW